MRLGWRPMAARRRARRRRCRGRSGARLCRQGTWRCRRSRSRSAGASAASPRSAPAASARPTAVRLCHPGLQMMRLSMILPSFLRRCRIPILEEFCLKGAMECLYVFSEPSWVWQVQGGRQAYTSTRPSHVLLLLQAQPGCCAGHLTAGPQRRSRWTCPRCRACTGGSTAEARPAGCRGRASLHLVGWRQWAEAVQARRLQVARLSAAGQRREREPRRTLSGLLCCTSPLAATPQQQRQQRRPRWLEQWVDLRWQQQWLWQRMRLRTEQLQRPGRRISSGLARRRLLQLPPGAAAAAAVGASVMHLAHQLCFRLASHACRELSRVCDKHVRRLHISLWRYMSMPIVAQIMLQAWQWTCTVAAAAAAREQNGGCCRVRFRAFAGNVLAMMHMQRGRLMEAVTSSTTRIAPCACRPA